MLTLVQKDEADAWVWKTLLYSWAVSLRQFYLTRRWTIVPRGHCAHKSPTNRDLTFHSSEHWLVSVHWYRECSFLNVSAGQESGLVLHCNTPFQWQLSCMSLGLVHVKKRGPMSGGLELCEYLDTATLSAPQEASPGGVRVCGREGLFKGTVCLNLHWERGQVTHGSCEMH